MLPASTRAKGMNVALPDVRPTPAGPAVVPVPYVNLAKNGMALGFSPNVLVSGANALNLRSKIPLSQGAEPALPPKNLASQYLAGNPVVRINNLPGINLACPTTGDNMSSPGTVVVASATNVLYTLAPPAAPVDAPSPGDPYARTLDARELGELGSLASRAEAVESRWLSPGVGYVAIRVFSADVPARVFSAIRALGEQGLEALVLDLRGNPGGEETAFVELAGDFLDAEQVVVTRIDAHGDETVLRSRRRAAYRWPVTILVDRGTASAAELFAGCLKAHGRARVVGERTFGKGVGQRVQVTAEGSARVASVVRYRLPDGSEVQGVGVVPEAEATGAVQP